MIPGDDTEEFIGFDRSRLYPCPQFAIDKSESNTNGNLYITWTGLGVTENSGEALNVYFSKSTDNGQTWSNPIVVHDDNKSNKTCQYYSNISVNPNGVIAMGWYDRRGDLNDDETHYYIAYSFDGGETFKPGFPITTVPTNFSTIGLRNSDFGIGEYNMLLTTKGYAIPVWGDGRTGDGDVNVYTAFVPITEDAISVESISPIDQKILISDISPNPSKNISNLNLILNENLNLKIDLMSIDGKIIKNIKDEFVNKGEYSYSLDLTDINSGEYFVFVQGAGIYTMKKIVIVK